MANVIVLLGAGKASWYRQAVQKFSGYSGYSQGHFSNTAVIDYGRVDYGFADNSPRKPVVAVCLNGAQPTLLGQKFG
jgi:hypothetical protein